MTLAQRTTLSRDDTDEVLARHETGVLSLADADEPYAIPVSYGFDRDARRFYLRLVSAPDSEKRQFLSAAPAARLVVYEADDPEYRSVIATGTLREIAPEDLTVEHVEQYGDAKRPLFEIWGEPQGDLEIRLYRFDPDEVSGRHVRVDREA